MAESPPTAAAEAAPSPAAAPPAVEPSAVPAEAGDEVTDHKRKLGDLDLNGEGEAPLKKQDVAADSEPAAPAEEVLKIDSGLAAENGDPAADVAVSESNGSGEETSEVEVKETVETTTTTVITVESLTVPAEAASEPVAATAATAAVTDGVLAEAASEPVAAAATATAEAAPDGGGETEKPDAVLVGNGQHPEHAPVESHETAPTLFPTTGQPPISSSRKIEIPNNKVGVLIGKAGETIKNLQFNSGAKIQIARDAEADPLSSTRPVEIIGTPENIDKAERLIRDVIAEADAGGSPALVARGFGSVQSGGEYIEMPVPNEKVGMIIGKGGETIKSLQTRSGARVQLIPQHLPAGDTSTERVVRITGHKSQIESAREMVKEVMNKVPRPSNFSGKYNQQNLRPRVPPTHSQWGPRAAAPTQQMTGYDYPQRGAQYPSQATQYPQTYGGYSQQPPSRSNIGAGWDPRQTAPSQGTLGYDYYGQGTPAAGVQASNTMSTLAPASMTPAPVNYNYGQPPPYAQSAPTQPGYGQGYSEPKYDQPPQSQQMYGQQAGSQPAVYGHQSNAPQSGYPQQQPYGRPGYANPVQEVPQTYGAPRTSQPGDPAYQGQVPPSHVQTGGPQQSYPYGSSAPAQPVSYGQLYGPTSGTVDGYAQPSSATYPQQGQVAPGYAQGGQPMPAYAQSGPQSGGYVQQYSQTQPSYVDQSAQSNVNYGYQGGPVDPGYASNVQPSGYPTPVPGGQAGYVQQPQPGYYEQSVPAQSVQGTAPGTAPVVYGGQVYGQN